MKLEKRLKKLKKKLIIKIHKISLDKIKEINNERFQPRLLKKIRINSVLNLSEIAIESLEKAVVVGSYKIPDKYYKEREDLDKPGIIEKMVRKNG